MSPHARQRPVGGAAARTINESLDDDRAQSSAWSPEPSHTTRPAPPWADDSLFGCLARNNDRDTAIGAAEMATSHRQALYDTAHQLIRSAGPDGLNADQVHAAIPDSHLPTISRRVSQLCKDGHIVDSGRRRPTRRGAEAIVWVAIEHAPRYTLEEIAEHLDPVDVAADEHAAASLSRLHDTLGSP